MLSHSVNKKRIKRFEDSHKKQICETWLYIHRCSYGTLQSLVIELHQIHLKTWTIAEKIMHQTHKTQVLITFWIGQSVLINHTAVKYVDDAHWCLFTFPVSRSCETRLYLLDKWVTLQLRLLWQISSHCLEQRLSVWVTEIYLSSKF